MRQRLVLTQQGFLNKWWFALCCLWIHHIGVGGVDDAIAGSEGGRNHTQPLAGGPGHKTAWRRTSRTFDIDACRRSAGLTKGLCRRQRLSACIQPAPLPRHRDSNQPAKHTICSRSQKFLQQQRIIAEEIHRYKRSCNLAAVFHHRDIPRYGKA